VINESIAVFNAIGTHMAWTAVRQPRPECTATALVIRAGGAEALVFLMIQR
jgi:hypothetical protein